jgi:hypothetical protein
MIVAATGWADAAIALGGIAFVTTVVSVAVWQIFATGRTSIASRGEKAYRKVAEDAADAQVRVASELERMNAELTDLRRQTTELARVLQEVE